ncbi:MAG: hypothetical protein QXH91_09090 [Candidatus Bathyarchaeia archaeon]
MNFVKKTSLTNILSAAIVEMLVPTVILAGIQVITILGSLSPFVGVVVLPITVGILQRLISFKKRKLDLFIVVSLILIVHSVSFWLPSIIFVLGFCTLVYLLTVVRRVPHFGVIFVLLNLLASLLILASGSMPLGGISLNLTSTFILFAVIGTSLYAKIVGDERLSNRPTIALTVGLVILSCSSNLLHIIGGRTGWLTGLIARRPEVNVLFSPTKNFLAPRAVFQTEEGLLIFNYEGLLLLRDGRLSKFRGLEKGLRLPAIPTPDKKASNSERLKRWMRVDQIFCDPDVKSICYIPYWTGISVVDLKLQKETVTRFPPASYALLIAEKQMRYTAILEDLNTPDFKGRVAIAKRVAPGELEEFAYLEILEMFPDLKFVNFLAFVEHNLLMLGILKDRRLVGISYNVKDKSFHKFMEDKDFYISGGSQWWYSAFIDEKLIVLPLFRGSVLILDTNGKVINKTRLFPFLRYILYDPQRKLCYIVSDLGF